MPLPLPQPWLHALLVALPLLATALPAHAELALAASRNCMGCHAVDRKVVGPAFRDVAARYAGQAGAAERLAQKIVRGGSGAWGVLAMPHNPQVSEADARRLAAWVLATK